MGFIMRKFSDWLRKRLDEGFSIRSHMGDPWGRGGDPITIECKNGLSFTVEEGPDPEGRDMEDGRESRYTVSNLSKPFLPNWPESGPDSFYDNVSDWEIDDLVDANGGEVDS